MTTQVPSKDLATFLREMSYYSTHLSPESEEKLKQAATILDGLAHEPPEAHWLWVAGLVRQIWAPTEYDEGEIRWRVRSHGGYYYGDTLQAALEDFWESEIRSRDLDGHPLEATPPASSQPPRSAPAVALADEIEAADVETIMQGDLLTRVVDCLRATQPPAAGLAAARVQELLSRCIFLAETGDEDSVTFYGDLAIALRAAQSPRPPLDDRAWVELTTEEQQAFIHRASDGLCGQPPQPPGDNPNEGPIVDGFVQVEDGVLPPFYNHWSCAQCGRRAEYVREDGCPERCGRVATSTKEPSR